jgi:hypothetical protein
MNGIDIKQHTRIRQDNTRWEEGDHCVFFSAETGAAAAALCCSAANAARVLMSRRFAYSWPA